MTIGDMVKYTTMRTDELQKLTDELAEFKKFIHIPNCPCGEKMKICGATYLRPINAIAEMTVSLQCSKCVKVIW